MSKPYETTTEATHNYVPQVARPILNYLNIYRYPSNSTMHVIYNLKNSSLEKPLYIAKNNGIFLFSFSFNFA